MTISGYAMLQSRKVSSSKTLDITISIIVLPTELNVLRWFTDQLVNNMIGNLKSLDWVANLLTEETKEDFLETLSDSWSIHWDILAGKQLDILKHQHQEFLLSCLGSPFSVQLLIWNQLQIVWNNMMKSYWPMERTLKECQVDILDTTTPIT